MTVGPANVTIATIVSRLHFVGVVVAALLASAAPLPAAVVSLRDVGGPSLLFEARPGERNDVAVVYAVRDVEGGSQATETYVWDDRASLEAGPGCRAIESGPVACARRGPSDDWYDQFLLGDGADVIRFTGNARNAELTIESGAGTDHILLGALAVTKREPSLHEAYGDGGDDTIFGGRGGWYITGDDGNDTLHGGDGGDGLEGGPGDDTLHGGPGGDGIYGNAGRDVITGGRGPDELVGGLGPDVLVGGRGFDYLAGGAGNDRLLLRDGARDDRADGGIGFDRACLDSGIDQISSVERLVCPRGTPLAAKPRARRPLTQRLKPSVVQRLR